MEKQTKRLPHARAIAAILALILCFTLVGMFGGCGETEKPPEPPIVLTPPEATPKVHSVAITYNDANVEGVLSVDVSQGTIKIDAVVSKDEGAEGTLGFASSTESVATVDGEGNVALLGAGETVLTASYGNEKCSIVLAVGGGTVGKYTVAVTDGNADITKASTGDIVTLTPVIPEHKEFVEWTFDYSDTPVTWISGNMFKMPAGDVTVKAVFTDMLYTLTLVGAKVTSDGGDTVQSGTVVGYDGTVETDEYAITEYKYPYETELSFAAVTPGANRMFVGWDKDIVNNRLNEEQEIDGVVMPDEPVTYWANFSDIRTKKLLTADGINNWETTVIDSDAFDPDPDLEGFSGYRVIIPANKVASSTFNEDIRGSVLNTVTNNSQAIRAIFKNHGRQPVTVEIYASYLTNLATSGWVTVPAGETVTKTFVALLGFPANPWWGFSLRENVGADGTVPLDIVMGCADAYPKGDKTLSVKSGTERVSLSQYADMVGSGLKLNVNNTYGWTLAASYEHGDTNVMCPTAKSARLTNLPAYDANDPYVTVYIRMLNQASSDHTYSYIFGLGKEANPLDDNLNVKPGTAVVDFTVSNHGETKLFALRVPRSEADTNFYFSIIKLEYDTPDKIKPESQAPYYAINFSLVLTYNNGIGFNGEVTE